MPIFLYTVKQRSPAFGELSDTHFFRFLVGNKEDRRAMWGEAPITHEDIFQTFAAYIEGKIPKLVRPYQPYLRHHGRRGRVTYQVVNFLSLTSRTSFLCQLSGRT